MRKTYFILPIVLICLINLFTINSYGQTVEQLRSEMVNKYRNQIPQEWSENATGVKNRIATNEKIIALTFDACGQGGFSDGYDKKLIDFLIRENIPATLFISGNWIDKNPTIFQELSKNSLFEIENHGTLHKPLSVNGKSAYGIKGTTNVTEVVNEILLNERKIQNVIGKKPKYFRSGTTFYDEVAVKIANDLGYEIINYNVLGDAGATFNKQQIINSAMNSTPGSIILYHMNRPESDIADGLIEVLPRLRNLGYRFVKLEEYHNQLAPRTILPSNYIYYNVVSGDSLWEISNKFGTTVQDVQKFNNLKTNSLYVNQLLILPITDPDRLTPPIEVSHSVVRGDSLWSISNRYKSSLSSIYRRNNLNEKSILQIGQRIIVPVEITHTVVSGDTLWHIGLRYGVSLQEIYDRNNLSQSSMIVVGQRIVIPSIKMHY
ncbi:LysM peptidoglycan-binding domain-containing protein [Serpentinicella alkaliphila]|uniref:Peptidoglycan/xylan/chitin deacetylase (PgdA/CDA1 family) n=1 Tax=Serpentinicella alkaliphila TaxID=1734049 RepID=A0A4R2T219_9FIRM|nr:LysM peptidoglycan-binding domain-containing protein [Serpentinicella alkaliphila]QUH26518.1 LysM peptidoglycan-binding domain-containing protein [Serpentinicella alkaliphila]TCP94844.1 peptidoglycan/xylan/chitin deacetylase (PgdA/CDA1 family) [Serpentinicella alkaliphila]